MSELRNQRDTSKPIDLVRLWFRSPHDKLPAEMMRTSEPPHERNWRRWHVAPQSNWRQRNEPDQGSE
jgi:hypothetical protein